MDAQKESVSTEAEIKKVNQSETETQQTAQAQAENDLVLALTPPTMEFNVESIPQDKLEMAETFGIPIKGILNYFTGMQKWQESTSKVLIAVTKNSGRLTSFLDQAETAMQQARATAPTQLAVPTAQPQAANSPVSANLMQSLMQFLPQLMNAPAQQANPMQDKLNALVNKALDDALNPEPSALEKVGQMFLEKIATKAASAMG